MRAYTTKTMLVRCDMGETAFNEAVKLLSPDKPMMLVCSEYSVSDLFGRWLWDNSRITSICYVPSEILKHENSWALYGYDTAVYSEGF